MPNKTHPSSPLRISRRAWLQQGALVLSASALSPDWLRADDTAPTLRIALVTDLHHADKPAAGTRHYRDTLAKLDEAAGRFAQEQLAFVVELGDFIDAAPSVDTELRYLSEVNRHFQPISDDRHYVLGNHCVDTLTKAEFLGAIGREHSYYSFDRGGLHFIVLDACFRHDGQPYGRKNSQWNDANLPPAEVEWLAADLASTKYPVIVFVHQRLDVAGDHGIKNAPQIRQLLEEHSQVEKPNQVEKPSRVLAVFQGHSHQNDLHEIGGIPYCTLVAMIEGAGPEQNGYSLLEIAPDHSLRLTGFRQQRSHAWSPFRYQHP
jgi:alkaline phosphatase